MVMAGLEIMDERGNRQTLGIVAVAIPVDGKVDHSQEGIGVYALVFADLLDGLVAKAEVDTKGSQTLQHIIIVPDDIDQFVIGLVHLLILHNRLRLHQYLIAK
jgi:hypothetical protein